MHNFMPQGYETPQCECLENFVKFRNVANFLGQVLTIQGKIYEVRKQLNIKFNQH